LTGAGHDINSQRKSPPAIMKTFCRRHLFLVVVFVMAAAAVPAQTPADSTSTVPANILDTLAGRPCQELKQVFYQQIPRYVYDDQPDQLYELVLFLDHQCDFGELLGRTQILASIWDGNFAEIIYGYEIVGWLADRYDEGKQAKPGSEREAFDVFTTDFANQLLPHAPAHSLELFYCLYYAGQTTEAWALLQSDDLADTWLRYYYDEEIDTLSQTDQPYIVGAHWGWWQPGGDLEFVGPKQLVGVSVEQWLAPIYVRLIIEGRIGRTDRPYLVNDSGVVGYSDRWDAVLLGIEGGVSLWRVGPHLFDAFLGVGYDVVKPFKDEEIAPASANLNVGIGYRWYPQRSRRWFVKADGRVELIGDRNKSGTNLGGYAYSARVGLGVSLGKNPAPRLKALGQAQ